MFPSLGSEDKSPPHITFLYVGKVSKERHEDFLTAVRDVFEEVPGPVQSVLQPPDYFVHPDKNRRVAVIPHRFSRDLAALRWKLRDRLVDAGFEVDDSFPLIYRPHTTLAYIDGLNVPYGGVVPSGSWAFDCIEIWGLPKMISIPFGEAPVKVARMFMAESTHAQSIALMKFLSNLAKRLGVAKHVYVVGGAVRNFVIKQPIKDIDMVIDSLTLGKDSAWLAKQIQRAITTQTKLVVDDYGVSKVKILGPMQYDGEDLQGQEIEIANARSESYTEDSDKPEVNWTTLEQDVYRREFTFNTLMWRLHDLANGPDKAEILDITGCGLKDLQEGTARCPADPDKTFKDDPTRMIRAVKFYVKYGLKVDKETETAIRRNRRWLHKSKPDAIVSLVIDVLLKGPKPKESLDELNRLGVLETLKEIMQKHQPFYNALTNYGQTAAIQVMFKMMDVGLPTGNALKFLTQSQQAQLRLVAVGMTSAEATQFFAVLKQPGKLMDTKSLMQEFALKGKEAQQLQNVARDILLDDPSTAQNTARLNAQIRERYRRGRVAGVTRTAKTFSINVGDPILYGKYLNKHGVITGFSTNEKGDDIALVDPVPKGQKHTKELKVFRFRQDPKPPEEVKEAAMRVRVAHRYRVASGVPPFRMFSVPPESVPYLVDAEDRPTKVANVAVDLNVRMERLFHDYTQAIKEGKSSFRELLDIGEDFKKWFLSIFRVGLNVTPKGGKAIKDGAKKFLWFPTSAVYSRGGTGNDPANWSGLQELRGQWEQYKPQIPDLIRFFTDEGGNEVVREIKGRHATYTNARGVATDTFKKYVASLESLFGTIKGWRSKAMAGNLKVVLAGPDSFRGTTAGKYVKAKDTLIVRATPKIMKRTPGKYGSPDYILIHELGHRYEDMYGTKGEDFQMRMWNTTRYSMAEGFSGASEGFAELFALGHFKIRKVRSEFGDVVDRFERLMTGGRLGSASRVAAKYQDKKKVKTPEGKEFTVYEYSERQVADRNKKKAERVEHLRKGIEKIRTQAHSDLKSKDDKTRFTALVVALMDDTYERVGNDTSAKEGHFGVTGWQKKHITFGKGKATIKYVGKSGVSQEKVVTDSGLVSMLRSTVKDKKPEDRLCQGEDCRVTSTDVNAYLKPFGVTAKDIRGFHANREMHERLKRVRSEGGKLPSDEKERAKKLKEEFKKALGETAEAVGHLPGTLKNQYLVPGLEEEFLSSGKVRSTMKKGTKSDGEKEDERTEDLVRPTPTKKPPRHDLRKEVVKDKDTDTEGQGADDDRDLSLNYKRIARVWMAKSMARVITAASGVPGQTDLLPGKTQETESGNWSGKNQAGKTNTYTTKELAEQWAKGDTQKRGPEDEKEGKPPPPTAEDHQKDADKVTRNMAAILDDMTGIPALKDQAIAAKKFAESDQEGLAQAYGARMHTLRKGMTDTGFSSQALNRATKALSTPLPDTRSPELMGKHIADLIFAQRVVADPTRVGGIKIGGVDADDEEGMEIRAQQSLKHFREMSPEIRKAAMHNIKAELKKTKKDSPKHIELNNILNGIVLAAHINGEPIDKSVRPAPAPGMTALAKVLDRQGNAKLLLGSVEDFGSPESRKAVRGAMDSMSDEDLTEFAQGTPYESIMGKINGDDWSDSTKDYFRGMVRRMALNGMTTGHALLSSAVQTRIDKEVTSGKSWDDSVVDDMVKEAHETVDAGMGTVMDDFTACVEQSKKRGKSDQEATDSCRESDMVKAMAKLTADAARALGAEDGNAELARQERIAETGDDSENDIAYLSSVTRERGRKREKERAEEADRARARRQYGR